MTQLLAGIWSTDGSAQLEHIHDPQNVGARWSAESFGLERLEMIIRSSSTMDTYRRYKEHLGKRLAIYSSWVVTPIAGFISEIRPIGRNLLLYIAKGPGWRLKDDLDTTVYAAATDVQTVIQTVLTDHVSVADSDQSNIAANTTALGGWQPGYPEGSYPVDIFRDMLDMSDAAGLVYDLWFQDLPFVGTALGGWIVYYVARSTSAPANWQVSDEDITRLTPSRDINQVVTDAEVFYGVITGTCATSPTDNYKLYEAAATFQSDGVEAGDRIVNLTDGSRAKVQRLEYNAPETTLYTTPLEGGGSNDWTSGDTYAIERRDSLDSVTSTSTPSYWQVKRTEVRKEMDATQAQQYADILVNNDASQNNPFVVSAPVVRDGNGAEWPIWEMIGQGGRYVRLNDLYPAAAVLTNSLNKLSTFVITGLDYDHTPMAMAVEVDNPSRRLDARLRAAGILNSEMVARQ